ncbi:hypothetical protein S83_035567, partial [Arachis hypogaea]
SHNSHRRSGSGSHNKTWVSDNESSDSNNGLTIGAIIGIIIGSILVAVILILALFFCVQKQKGKEKVTRTSSGSLPHGTTNEEGSWFHIRETSLILHATNLKITSRFSDKIYYDEFNIFVLQISDVMCDAEYKEEGIVSLGNLKTFTFRELQQAIDSFSSKNILGAGGFGNVYREKLGDGSMVAVKRLKDVTGSSGESQFRTELEMISLAVHRNLLRLIGYCATPNEKLLENVNTRHLQLLYESKLYRILQGGTLVLCYLVHGSSFRDRRSEYKGLNKVWKGKLSEAKASGNPMKIQEAQ